MEIAGRAYAAQYYFFAHISDELEFLIYIRQANLRIIPSRKKYSGHRLREYFRYWPKGRVQGHHRPVIKDFSFLEREVSVFRFIFA